jgi:uncharacterized protein (TIGR03118 family)
MFALGGLLLVIASSTAGMGAGINSYLPTILTVDDVGKTGVSAPNVDSNLKNPWGLAFGGTSPFWNSDQLTGVSTLYNANGLPVGGNPPPLVVAIPGGGSPPFTGPTGVVQDSSTVATDFPVAGNGGKASFIFATLNGTIAAWNGASGVTASVQPSATVAGAEFTGLALANAGTSSQPQFQLYAADFSALTGSTSKPLIDVFDHNFANVTSTTAFNDSNLPAGLRPYNIWAVPIPGLTANGPVLVVTFRGGNGGSAVDFFDVNGNPLGIRSTDSHLFNPWGVALAPAGFGAFGGDLLIGNVGNDQINAFNPQTLAFLGTLLGPNGQPVAIPGASQGGLWGLGFRQAGGNPPFDPNALYFNAGVNGGGNFFSNGIFGEITAVPEPASAILLGLGLIVLLGACRWVTRRGRCLIAQPLTLMDRPR